MSTLIPSNQLKKKRQEVVKRPTLVVPTQFSISLLSHSSTSSTLSSRINTGRQLLFYRRDSFLVWRQTLDSIKDSDDIDDLIGGETMDGEAEMLHRCVVDFRGGVEFTNYKNEQERYEQEIEKAIQRIRRIPEAAKLSKQKKQNESVKQKRPTAAEAVENKKRRTEEKMAKEKLAEREKEAKAKKWAEDSAFIELRKAVHGTGTH
ncbi:hypothetical protein MJO29_002512 [Puccinia striiformis f. sp. tritici]|nr:hypothetical protein MJO29_002512 [Puccinia striiformis f. sp. tritici]